MDAIKSVRAGTKLPSPDGKGGYKLTMDIRQYDPIMAEAFKPYGGQQKAEAAAIIPDWIIQALRKAYDAQNEAEVSE